MARLKSRTAHPPWGFRYLQPEVGMTKEIEGSFNFVVEQVIMIRKANPFLCERHGWRTDTAAVEMEIEQYNVARCINGGWLDFILPDEPGPVPAYTISEPQKKTRVAAVDSVKRVSAGVALLVDWLGSGGKPVEAPLAEKRAMVCASCPKNDGGDWKSYFTEPIAEKIRVQLEMKNDLQLRTSHDPHLTVCSACDCPLPLKVHVPIFYILEHTSHDTKTRLDPRCWITAEESAL